MSILVFMPREGINRLAMACDEALAEKVRRVNVSCETPEQRMVAMKYQALAEKTCKAVAVAAAAGEVGQ